MRRTGVLPLARRAKGGMWWAESDQMKVVTILSSLSLLGCNFPCYVDLRGFALGFCSFTELLSCCHQATWQQWKFSVSVWATSCKWSSISACAKVGDHTPSTVISASMLNIEFYYIISAYVSSPPQTWQSKERDELFSQWRVHYEAVSHLLYQLCKWCSCSQWSAWICPKSHSQFLQLFTGLSTGISFDHFLIVLQIEEMQ